MGHAIAVDLNLTRQLSREANLPGAGGCQLEAQIYASFSVCEHLSPQLEDLVTNRGCNLRIISTQAMAIPGAEIISLPLPAGVSDPEATPWLQLVVDREPSLTAQFRG